MVVTFDELLTKPEYLLDFLREPSASPAQRRERSRPDVFSGRIEPWFPLDRWFQVIRNQGPNQRAEF